MADSKELTITVPRPVGNTQLKKTLYNSDGFTLVELLIAFVILSILASLSAPSLSTIIPKQRLYGAAQKIVWDLQAARMLAIKQKRHVSITFVNASDYKIWQDRNNDNIEDSNEVTVKSLHDDYRGVSITSLNNPTFNPLGTVSNAPHVGQPITLTNVTGSKTIVISIAGRVKLS